jgi:HK97 family phage major capsid protein
MKTLKEINERLAAIAADINKRSAELSATEFTAYETEVAELKEARTALLEAQEKRTALLASITDGTAPAATVVRSFAADAAPEEVDRFDTAEYRKAFMNYATRGMEVPAEYRTNETSKTTDVGAVIPTTVLNGIVEKLEATGMILPLVTRTAYKGGVSIPVSIAKPVATWVAEGAGSDKQKKTVARDGMITFAYHKLRCAVAVSVEVDTMAISAFEAMLINNIVEAMTKAIEAAIITGTGTGQPKGILSETAPTGQALTISALAYKDLVDAEAALPQAYESGAVWCMSKKTFMQYYGLTDTNGQPIGRVNYGIAGKPERSLLGRTVICCDYVTSFASSIAVGTKFGFLFNFKDYVLNTNYQMGIKKYEDNDTDDMVTKAIMLVDGKVVDVNSLVTLAKKA